MSDTTTASVRETHRSAFAVEIEVSGHTLVGDEPLKNGGGDLGPSPFDLLTAALSECTTMTVRWYANRQKWPLDDVEVEVTHQKLSLDEYAAKTDTFAKKVRLIGDALTDEQRQRLLGVAARCPVQRTLESEVRITTTSA